MEKTSYFDTLWQGLCSQPAYADRKPVARSCDKTPATFNCDTGRLFFPTGKTRIVKKTGEEKKELKPAGVKLDCKIHAFGHDLGEDRNFRIVPHTSPIKLAKLAQKVRRVCGDAAAENFLAEGRKVLATSKRKPKPEKHAKLIGLEVSPTWVTIRPPVVGHDGRDIRERAK
jgi:hypothetical protein